MVLNQRYRTSVDVHAHQFFTRWAANHSHTKETEFYGGMETSPDNVSGSAKATSWEQLWTFFWRNHMLIICPVLSLYFPIKYKFSRDSMGLFVCSLTIGNWLIEGLPFEILCLPPIILCLQEDGFRLDNLVTKPAMVSESEEIACLSAAIISNAVVRTNLHKRIASCFIYWTDTRPQKVLAGVMLLTALTNFVMAPILTVTLLHPVFSAVLDGINNCRKIRLSQDGALKRERIRSDFEFHKFSTAIRLALPFTVNLTTSGILYQNQDRYTLVDLGAWLNIAVPVIIIQCFFLWFILVVRFIGYKKLWNWTSGVENMYAIYQRKTERKTRPNMRLAEFLVTCGVGFLIFLSVKRILLQRVLFWDDCDTKCGCTLNLERATMLVAVIVLLIPSQRPNYFILGNFSGETPRGEWKPLVNWNDDYVSMPWDVILYIYCSDLFLMQFKKSALIETMRKDLYAGVMSDFISVFFNLTSKVMLYTNFLNTPLIHYLFLEGLQTITSLMFLASVAILIIVQISANYNFIFPTSNTTNMLAYSAGGIYKKDMILCGFFVWMMCHVTFVATFVHTIPALGLQNFRGRDYSINEVLLDKVISN